MSKQSLNKFISLPYYTQPLLFGMPLVLGISTPVMAQMYEGVSDFPRPTYYNSGQNQSYVEFNATPSNQPVQNSERYLVYVDSNNFQTLQQVRQVEPTAFIRQFQRRYIIQAGVFHESANAQRRIRELAAYGVNNTRIFSLNQRREVPNNDAIGGLEEQVSRYYYVVIPSSQEDAVKIADRIQQSTGFYRGITARNHGLGHHVAVGPFAQSSDAQKWNHYLHNMGFGNARVYYGR